MEELNKLKEIKAAAPKKKGRFEPWEVTFIKANYDKKSDKQIGAELNRDDKSIFKQRHQLGLKKPTGRPSNSSIVQKASSDSPERELVKEEYKNLTRDQKKKLFESRFKHTKRYSQLTATLDEDEMEFYIEKWLDYGTTWETILETEVDSLHLAIMELILANRILIRQREALDDEDENNRVPIEIYDRHYREHIDTYNKLMSTLAGTRQQRLSVEKEDRFNITTIVQQLQDMEIRRKAGKEAAIIDAAKDAAFHGMRNKNFLVD